MQSEMGSVSLDAEQLRTVPKAAGNEARKSLGHWDTCAACGTYVAF
jgi:hypothetical protein